MNKIWLIALISIVLGTVSCSKDEPEAVQPTLSVKPVTLVFTAQASESHEVIVTTNQLSWDAISSQSWCTVTKDNGKFTVRATANTSTSSPVPAIITVTAGNAKPVTVNVTQSGIGANLSVSPNTPISFTSTGGASETKTFSISTNQASWDATSSQSWCVITKGTNLFTVVATANTTSSERTATITVTAGNATNVTIDVKQEKYSDELSNSLPRIYVSGTGDNAVLSLTVDPAVPLVYFKFGSVIGISNAENYSASAVVFNPSSIAPADNWSSFAYMAENANVNAYYQKSTNIRSGFGDPCRLVGLTIAQIKAGQVDNGKWRLPTKEENEALGAGGGAWVSIGGIGGGVFPENGGANRFLPAGGYRHSESGELQYATSYARYWSNTSKSETEGYSFSFYSTGGLSPIGVQNKSAAFCIRCVLQ